MTPAEAGYLGVLIDFALTEDLSDDGDVTSRGDDSGRPQRSGRVRCPRAGGPGRTGSGRAGLSARRSQASVHRPARRMVTGSPPMKRSPLSTGPFGRS